MTEISIDDIIIIRMILMMIQTMRVRPDHAAPFFFFALFSFFKSTVSLIVKK